jgi:hypothetical protein
LTSLSHELQAIGVSRRAAAQGSATMPLASSPQAITTYPYRSTVTRHLE